MPLLVGVAASLAVDPASAKAGGSDIFCVEGVGPWGVLNMRAGPGAHYRIIDTLSHNGGGIEHLSAQAGDWHRVRHSGRIGWVNTRFLAPEL